MAHAHSSAAACAPSLKIFVSLLLKVTNSGEVRMTYNITETRRIHLVIDENHLVELNIRGPVIKK